MPPPQGGESVLNILYKAATPILSPYPGLFFFIISPSCTMHVFIYLFISRVAALGQSFFVLFTASTPVSDTQQVLNKTE